MVYYNLTNVTQGSNMYDVFKNINDLSNGLIPGLILFSLFVVILMAFPNTSFSKLLVVDSFVVSFVAFLMFVLGFIPWSFLILPLVLLMGSLIGLKING